MKPFTLPKLNFPVKKDDVERKTTRKEPPKFNDVLESIRKQKRLSYNFNTTRAFGVRNSGSFHLSKPFKSGNQSEDDDHFYFLQIQVLSNYGNDSIIGCSEIDVLDSKNQPLRISEVQFDPFQEEKLNSLSDKNLLINSSLIKETDEAEWCAPWIGPFVIDVKVAAKEPPSFIRIWNSRIPDHRSVNHVKINAGEEFIAEAEIPESFGSVINISKLKELTEDKVCVALKKVQKFDDAIIDCYGEVPVHSFKKIRIVIMSTFRQTGYLGLDLIEIVSFSGKTVSLYDDIENIICKNLTNISAPQRLFRNTNGKEGGESWLANYVQSGDPEIEIEFKLPIYIAFLRFWNVKAKETANYGVYKIKIYFGDELMNVGKLNKGTENETMPTCFWYTDIPALRGKVKVGTQDTLL